MQFFLVFRRHFESIIRGSHLRWQNATEFKRSSNLFKLKFATVTKRRVSCPVSPSPRSQQWKILLNGEIGRFSVSLDYKYFLTHIRGSDAVTKMQVSKFASNRDALKPGFRCPFASLHAMCTRRNFIFN